MDLVPSRPRRAKRFKLACAVCALAAAAPAAIMTAVVQTETPRKVLFRAEAAAPPLARAASTNRGLLLLAALRAAR